jgi:hypothetical protein
LIPGTLALITAFVGFATLVLVPIPMIRELAITASVGVACRSQRRKSEVLCDRSRSGRPYLLRQAPSPQGFPFPLGFISHSLGREESKGKK